MTDKPEHKKDSIKKAFTPGEAKDKPSLFLPDEMDIYCNKITKETFIFHGKAIDYDALERMEYDPKTHEVDVFLKDGSVLDLGVKIQWLIRPYFTKAEEVQIVQTKDGEAIDGTFVPITHKGK
ncbi:MAG TPA: hypothetical protein PK513_07170 [Alphaproteobacteria bacterium]|nr:hypothetical protein [Alphaproteobacteria bacterium]USO04726.1 MAG: hypothetical protein H6859_06035 [Rhodospirillales bacterium]HOO82266.1 hypothetical protein [Alphaproteobacteria bacterium]